MKEGSIVELSANFLHRHKQLFYKSQAGLVNVREIPQFDPSCERELIELLSSFFTFFSAPGLDPALAPSWLHLECDDLEEVTFYPGTFNPWHPGHFNCLKLCPEKTIVVVPDFSPWKGGVSKTPWERVQEILDALENLPYMVYPAFTLLDSSHPTYEWMNKVRRPKRNLIVGMDNFLALSKWHKGSELLSILTKLYVVPRDIKDTNLMDRDEAHQFVHASNPNLQVIVLPQHDEMGTSSSDIRAQK